MKGVSVGVEAPNIAGTFYNLFGSPHDARILNKNMVRVRPELEPRYRVLIVYKSIYIVLSDRYLALFTRTDGGCSLPCASMNRIHIDD